MQFSAHTGSITLVTHFYRNRAELLKGISGQLIDDYDAQLADLEKGADDPTRLRVLLEWMLPLTQEARNEERARVLLNAERHSDLHVQSFFKAMDGKMRALLRDHVTPLVEPSQVDITVDALRVMVNGVVLSAVEHPRKWPAKRQLALLDHMLESLGVSKSPTTTASTRVSGGSLGRAAGRRAPAWGGAEALSAGDGDGGGCGG